MIRFFICSYCCESLHIVNAESEQEAYRIITGNDGPVPEEDWECTEITLKPGENLDLSRFV